MNELQGKVAIITGGGRGLGQAYCLGFAEEGAKVVVADIISCDETIEQIKAKGGETNCSHGKCDANRYVNSHGQGGH